MAEAKNIINARETQSPEPIENTVSDYSSDTESEGELKNTESEFNRRAVEELTLGKDVRLADSDTDLGLDLFCYVKCSNIDSDILKQCRGVVFHGDEIVLKAFPYPIEYNHTELAKLEDVLEDFSQFSFYDSYEGALIRVFNFGGKWFLSTHRKLNAFRSKWASRESFGTHFKNALVAEKKRNSAFRNVLPTGDNILEQFYQILDKDKQYMFLILNGKDNRIVCEPPQEPTVFHVGTFVDGQLSMGENIYIPYPHKHTFLNIDELIHYVENIDYTILQGVIGFGPNNTQIKVFNKTYQDLFRVRGNEPSIKFRYLQVRMNERMTNMLKHLYPQYIETFKDYENTLYDIACMIYRAYVQRFIKKITVTVPRREFKVMKECHDWHLEDRKNNRISKEKVQRVLNQQSATNLNHMIRNYKSEQLKKDDEKEEPRAYGLYTPHQSANSTPVLSPLLLPRNNTRLPPPPDLKL